MISTQGRRGTFVRSTLLEGDSTSGVGAARGAPEAFTTAARRSGLSLAEATRLVESSWPRTTG